MTAEKRGGRFTTGALLLAAFLAGAGAGCTPGKPTTGPAAPTTAPGGKQPDDKGKPKPPANDPG